MLDGGGGGYAGTTNWYQYDVEAMWRMLEGQQTNSHWRHATGWRRTSELTYLHSSRLSCYRENLVDAWPPERNEAARAYLDRFDHLIKTVDQTSEVAGTNGMIFRSALSAISSARGKIKEIYDEYVVKKAAKAEQDRRAASGTPTPSPSPSGERPVTQADLDRLNNRARAIMYALSGELVQARMQLRQPPSYKAMPRFDDGGTPVGGGGSAAPPVIPPVVPVPTVPPPPSNVGGPPPSPLQVVPTPTAPSTGPILGGTTPPAAPPSPVAPPVITPTPTQGPTPLPPGTPGPLPPGGGLIPKPGVPGGPPFPSTVPPSGNNFMKPGATPAGGLPKAMPPGGMIGGLPGAGLGQPAPATGPARRINPVGGLIGGGGQGSGSVAGGAGRRPGIPISGVRQTSGPKGTSFRIVSNPTASGMTGTPSVTARSGWPTGNQGKPRARSEQGGDPRGSVQWDPDNPWATDSGVAPVVTPPPKPGRIDPGPAIGSNR